MFSRSFLCGTLVVFLLGTSTTQAAFMPGYTTGAGSQLLESNNLGAGGEVLFVDGASSGSSDFRADGGQIGWVSELSGVWAVGDEVSLTGLAIPIWANSTPDDATNNTQNDTWVITWYQLDGGANPNQYDGTNGGEAPFTTNEVVFNSANTGVGAYYVVFDSPVTFTATSTGIGFNIKSKNGGSLRFKAGSSQTTTRRNGSNGNALSPSWSTSLAGTVTPAIPEPTSMVLFSIASLWTMGRRR